MATGPLVGVKVLEFAGLGPGPLAGTFLSDLGADVLRIERIGAGDPPATQIDARGRRAMMVDLKSPDGIALCLDLIENADILFEGNRPGVMERLGLGPDVALARNPRLVYGRMTGWGQFGPYSAVAGHDINYLALTGGLHAIGTKDRPVPPLNLASDYGGGAMFLISGVLAALLHARSSGQGQVVDVAMTDGTAYLMSIFYGMLATGDWKDERASNLLDGAAPFYDVYECADGKWISIGSMEPQFYALLLEKTGAGPVMDKPQMSQADWPEMKSALQDVLRTKSRDEWCEIMEFTDVCFAPVLSMEEAPNHPHNVARKTFIDVDGVVQPAPAPRFSATPAAVQWGPAPIDRDGVDAMIQWGLPEAKARRSALKDDAR